MICAWHKDNPDNKIEWTKLKSPPPALPALSFLGEDLEVTIEKKKTLLIS